MDILHNINLLEGCTPFYTKQSFYETMLFRLMHFSFFILNFLPLYNAEIAFFDCYFKRLIKIKKRLSFKNFCQQSVVFSPALNGRLFPL